MSTDKSFDFYFDYASPYSYLADTQISAICENTGARVNYKPVLLGAIFKITGNKPPMANPVKSKVDYGMKDIYHWVDYYQCPMEFNPFFPVNSLALMRIACLLQHNNTYQEYFKTFHEAAFKAIWLEKRNMGEMQEVESLINSISLDIDDIKKNAFSESNKEKLKQETQAAVDKNIFGVPSFTVGTELFFGNDRIPLVEHFLKKS